MMTTITTTSTLRLLCTVLLLALGSGTLLLAQADDSYDPQNPPEPKVLYRITTQATEGCSASGTGSYSKGAVVHIHTSGSTGFTFSHWTLNGERYEAAATQTSFSYTVGEEDAAFMAVYDYTPNSPAEPMAINEYRLYLGCEPEEACSFSRDNGAKALADNYVSLRAYPSQGFVFQGWYENGQKVSDSEVFSYLMPFADAKLTARYVYSPTNPDEPSSAGGDIDNGTVGDINGDHVTNIADAVMLVNHYLNGTTGELPLRLADVNGDGEVNVSDAVAIVNRYLNNQ